MEIFGSYMSDKHTLGGEAVLINLAVLALLSLPCVFGYNIWSDLHIIGGHDVLDSEGLHCQQPAAALRIVSVSAVLREQMGLGL